MPDTPEGRPPAERRIGDEGQLWGNFATAAGRIDLAARRRKRTSGRLGTGLVCRLTRSAPFELMQPGVGSMIRALPLLCHPGDCSRWVGMRVAVGLLFRKVDYSGGPVIA